MTTEQRDNLAKHIMEQNLEATEGEDFTPAQMLYLWNVSNNTRSRYRILADVFFAMAPNDSATYLDAAPF